MSEPTRGETVYRLLMRAYPKRFRDRFGPDLLAVFREQRGEPEYDGMAGALRFWKDIGIDWIRTVVAARRSFGGVQGWSTPPHLKTSEIGTWEVVVDAIRQDLGFAVRSLLRAPGFTLIATLTLAVGIGSTAAIFGVVKGVLMEPLPYEEPDEIVTIWSSWVGFPKTWVSQAEYRLYLTGTRSFEDLALWNETNLTFTDPSNPERVLGVGVTSNLVDVLGLDMAAGRFFTEDEALASADLPAEVIVISHEAWMRRWSGDPGIIGRSVEMNGRSREVIGVMPEGFRLPTQFAGFQTADIFFPRYVSREEVTSFPRNGGSHGSYVVGRLRDGVTPEAAQADVSAAIARVNDDFGVFPPERDFRPLVFRAVDDVFGTIRPAIMALLATVVFVLLIACANVANLMLARSDDRADELTVRAALGAGRGRLVGQLLTESFVLAVVGGLAGIGLAVGGVELFRSLNPGNLPRIDEVALDGGVLAFAALVTVGTALLFGTLPALRVTRDGLKSRMGRRSERGVGQAGWQGTLVAAETSLAVVLVIGAALMARTFNELTAIEPGFESDNTLTLALSIPTTRYPDPEAATQFFRQVLQDVEALPGVRSAAAIHQLPLGSQIGDWGIDVEGYDESVNPSAAGDWQIASPGYFSALGIPIVEGRDFDWNDDAEAAAVGIVNQTLVDRYFDGVNPVGRSFRMSGTDVTIVGIAGDVRHNGLTAEIKPKFYIPVAQWGLVTGGIPTSLRLVVRTEGDASALSGSVRDVVHALDPSLAVAEVRTVDEVLSAAVAQPRFVVVLMGAFGVIALVLAMVGVYGVISYGVGKRTQEIGVRIAMGALQNDVVGLMVRKGSAMVAVGLATGLVLAFALSRYIESLLYGVTATDPLTFVGVVLGFAVVAMLATWLPSRRAARIDPIRALKMD